MAADAGSLPHLDLGGYAPANPGRGCRSALRDVPPTLSCFGSLGSGERRGRARELGRARLLPPSPDAPRREQAGGLRPWRRLAALVSANACAAWYRRLHCSRYCEHRFRRAAASPGRQRSEGPGADGRRAARHRRRCHAARPRGRGQGSDGCRAARFTGRLHAGLDRTWRGSLRSPHAEVRAVPLERIVFRTSRWECALPAYQGCSQRSSKSELVGRIGRPRTACLAAPASFRRFDHARILGTPNG